MNPKDKSSATKTLSTLKVGLFLEFRYMMHKVFMFTLFAIDKGFMLQPPLAPLNLLGQFSMLARITSDNPSHSAMLMVNPPKPRTPRFIGGGPTVLHLHSRLTAQSVTNGMMWISHPWKSNLELIIALPKQHCNYPSHTRQLCFHIGPMPIKSLPFGLGWWGHTTSPI